MKFSRRTLFSIILMVLLAFTASLHADVRVDVEGGNHIYYANTSRNVAVAPNGDIYVAWYGNGIKVAKSSDGGQSFGEPKQIIASNYEVEVAVSSNGTVYLAWVDTSTSTDMAKLVKSTDEGETFSSPNDIGDVSSSGVGGVSIHLATSDDKVFAVAPAGDKLFYSTDGGETFDSTSTGGNYVYSDVAVNEANGNVIVQTDAPNVYFFKSTNDGESLDGPHSAGVSVSYSIGALANVDGTPYFYVAGPGGGYRVDLTNISSPSPVLLDSLPATSTSRGRSIAADQYGNVVTSYTNSDGGVEYAFSNDKGDTFSSEAVSDSASSASVAINKTNGDVVVVYESGGENYCATYSNKLSPIAKDDTKEMYRGSSVNIDVLANDSAPYSNIHPSTVTVTTGPFHGTTSVNTSTGEITYTLEKNFLGVDSFKYTVENDDGKTSNEATVSITVKDDSPTAEFTYTPTKPNVEKEVKFDATDSSDPDGKIVSYEWDFGDGNTATGEEVTHTYKEEGTYTAELTVTDNDDLTDTASTEIEVKYEREYVQVEHSGWSMVSAPLNPKNKAPTDVFKGVDQSTIFHWNPGAKGGEGDYITPADDYKVSALHGTWINLNESEVPKVFSIPGIYSGNVTIELSDPGWHQVGTPLDYGWADLGVKQGEDSETMTVAEQSAGPSSPHWMSRFIYNWDPQEETYTVYEAGNSSFQLEPGKAYWIRTYEEGVKLVVPHAAPPPVPTETVTQPEGIPMNSQKADQLDLPTPPSPPRAYSVGEFGIQATPNPVTDNNQVTFIAAGSEVQTFEVTVYDSSGKQMHASGTNTGHTYTWNPKADLSNGLYLYQVLARTEDGGTLTETGKLLVLQ